MAQRSAALARSMGLPAASAQNGATDATLAASSDIAAGPSSGQEIVVWIYCPCHPQLANEDYPVWHALSYPPTYPPTHF